MKALIATLATAAALSGAVQAAVPASAAAQPKADAVTCDGYYHKYEFYSWLGVTSLANFYRLVWQEECIELEPNEEGPIIVA
jgi:hypothetical protein